MTPADLLAWREHMGYTHRTAAEALGVTLATYQSWERGKAFSTGKPTTIDQRTALACAALAAGLAPWSPTAADAPRTPSSTR